jgi:arylsulfatase
VKATENNPPNILMVLIDDLGYTDLDVYGGDISTPNINNIANQGMVFTDAHAYPSCAPTRAAFLTGQDPHTIGLGSQNGVAPAGVTLEDAGYEGYLSGKYTSIANLLKSNGYRTYHSGKWHLGYGEKQSPIAQGFERHFSLLDGAASHYGDMKGVGLGVSGSGSATYVENGERLKKLPDNFYSTKNYTQWLIDELAEGKADARPFFAYLAYTAVHDPLHAPEDLILKYASLTENGYEQLRKERIKNLVSLGLTVDPSLISKWLSGTPRWSSLTEDEQKDLSKRLAVYAAMLEYLDHELGRLVDFLKSEDLYDNTLIVLMSDNGAATVPKTIYSRNVSDIEWQNKNYPLTDVSSYGLPGSFPSLGTYNAEALAGPYFGFKSNLYEGGVRVPMIVKTPGREDVGVRKQNVNIVDLYKTFSDYAGVTNLNNDQLLGCSLRQTFEWNSVGECSDEFGMSYMGWRSYRKGVWKLVFVSSGFGGTGKYALYKLDDDPGEMRDLSSDYPEKVAYLNDKWNKYAKKNNVKVIPMEKVNSMFDPIAGKFFEIDWGSNSLSN